MSRHKKNKLDDVMLGKFVLAPCSLYPNVFLVKMY